MLNRTNRIIVISFLIGVIACKKSNNINSTLAPDPISQVLNLPASPFNYTNPALPAYLTTPNILGQINTSISNPATDWGATLGRVLFYDKNLSINRTISCGSCHKQANGFSDPIEKSKGFDGGLTGRNSMSLVNAIYYPNGTFFWDQRATTLEQQQVVHSQ